jgi:hypothetical protein
MISPRRAESTRESRRYAELGSGHFELGKNAPCYLLRLAPGSSTGTFQWCPQSTQTRVSAPAALSTQRTLPVWSQPKGTVLDP